MQTYGTLHVVIHQRVSHCLSSDHLCCGLSLDSMALRFKMATDRAAHVDPVERLKEEHKAWKHHHPQVCSFRMEL